MGKATYIDSVPRETSERLDEFLKLVRKWNKKINLLSDKDESRIWQRHMLDSIQLANVSCDPKNWVDLGSGGGFPAIPMSIVWAGQNNPHKLHLVESDLRKAAFLRTCIRELGLPAEVHAIRIEDLVSEKATLITARALSKLEKLLWYCDGLLGTCGTALFPKGKTWVEELEKAEKSWNFSHEIIRSDTDSKSVVLRIRDVTRK